MAIFGKSGFRAASAISGNFSAVFLASIVLPIFTERLDLTRLPVVTLGMILTLGAGLFALLAAERGKL